MPPAHPSCIRGDPTSKFLSGFLLFWCFAVRFVSVRVESSTLSWLGCGLVFSGHRRSRNVSR